MSDEGRRIDDERSQQAAPAVLLAALLLLPAAACQQPEATGPRPVEDSALGIAFADLPADCQEGAGEPLTLDCALDGAPGTVTFEEGVEGESNLLALANEQKVWFLGKPGGQFAGNRELVTPGGSGYTARGTYEEDGRPVEETRVLVLHPTKDRPLIIRYRYAPVDRKATQGRIDHMLLLVGELGAPGGAAPAPAE